MFEITFIDNGKTIYLTYVEACDMFGAAEFDEIKQGYLPHIVCVEIV